MLYYDFCGYEGFQALFGIQHHGNGEKSRKNKILLAYIKNKDLLHQAVVNTDYSLLHISSMTALKQTMLNLVSESGKYDDSLPHKVKVMDYVFYSNNYATDLYDGLCTDGDCRAIRYVNMETDKVYKMKAGKLLRALILETAFGQTISEQVLTYLLEEFTAEWITYASRAIPDYRLVVDDNFWKIYDSDELEGEFGSCMVDKDFYTFYEDAVDAKAAYLLNENDKIVARCVVFTDVHEQGSDKVWRLAERQYASDGSDVLKRQLIDALIQQGEIDGYKKVGAGCGDAREFVDLDGNSLSDKRFYISCALGLDDPLSYQDSFKWYSYGKDIAYNHSDCNYDYELDTTDGALSYQDDNSGCEYDDFHGYSCDSVTLVYCNGHEYYCDTENLDDFELIEGDYYHIDDCFRCQNCGEWHLQGEALYSEITGEDYCSEDCRDEAELVHMKIFWTYSEYDDEYFENEDDVVSFWKWDGQIQDYQEVTIYVGTLIDLLRTKQLHLYENEVYDKLRRGKPMRLAA